MQFIRDRDYCVHQTQREQAILAELEADSFMAFRELAKRLGFPQPTLRRDLQRMEAAGSVIRTHGGVKRAPGVEGGPSQGHHLLGVPFHENINRNRAAKEAIGEAAAALCKPGEAVMIDGGSTTLQMCPHLGGLGLQVLTNSLHIVMALLGQGGTRISVPGGAVFREQNIILSTTGDELMPRMYAPKLFMGAAAVGPQGVMQADTLLVAAEQQLIDRAEEVILLVDSSKFEISSGNVLCGLSDVDFVVTDKGLSDEKRAMLEAAGIKVIIAD